MKTLMITILTTVISLSAFGQLDSKLETIKIKTSVQCEMCTERVTEALAFEKGVKSVDVNLETQVVTVGFKKGKNNVENLREAISKAGYDADDMEADAKAYSKLPGCCKKPDDPEHKSH